MLGLTMARARVVMTESTIRVGVLPYRVTLPLSELVSDQARKVDDGDAVRLKWRKNGIGLPGLCVGHLTTRNGRPVFAAVGGSRNQVLIPTHRDFDLLVTAKNASGLIAAVQSVALGDSILTRPLLKSGALDLHAAHAGHSLGISAEDRASLDVHSD